MLTRQETPFDRRTFMVRAHFGDIQGEKGTNNKDNKTIKTIK